MMRGIITPKGNKQVSFHIECEINHVKKCCALWGLAPPKKLNLAQTAADFYLAYDLSIDFLGFRLNVNEKAKFLAEQFSRYLIMAIGGEVRHAATQIKQRHYAKGWRALNSITQKLSELIIAEQDKSPDSRLPRSRFWVLWRRLYHKYGTTLLDTAQRLFTEYEWDSAYGGESWGKICEVLLRWLRGQDSDIVFVDTCWGLHHNGDIVFDKLWSIHNLKSVLDSNQKGDMLALCERATPTMRDLWVKYDAKRQERKDGVV